VLLSPNGQTAKIDGGPFAASVEIVSGDFQQRAAQFIREHRVVVGCVAWLTSRIVTSALSEVESQIVLQKEDWLRPDTSFKVDPRRFAGSFDFDRYCLAIEGLGGLSGWSFGGDPAIEKYRCSGHTRQTRYRALMHHKFLVGLEATDQNGHCEFGCSDCGISPLRPVAVWTGSANLSANCDRGAENVVIIRSQEVATEYAKIWENVLKASEPLDYSAEYHEPEWREGS
jgi:hypothetical protein